MIGERYQTHPIIHLFCDTQDFISSEHQNFLQDFYITLASCNAQSADTKKYSEMVLEVNNTKAILTKLLNSNYLSQPTLIKAVLQFTRLCISIGDCSDKLISQAVTFLEQSQSQDQSNRLLLIQCLRCWGNLFSKLRDCQNAMSKLHEAEEQCLSLKNEGPLYGKILSKLGDVHLQRNGLDEAEVIYKKALICCQGSKADLGDIFYKLGDIYIEQRKWDEAEASYQQASKLFDAASSMGQDNVYAGLGTVYKKKNQLDKAEAAFQKALELHKTANELHAQGCDYADLGDVYLRLDKLERAEITLKKALELHIMTNSIISKAVDYELLEDVSLKQNRLNDAEASFQKTLHL